MYVIAKLRDGHRAIPIRSGDKWGTHILRVGRTERRIILHVRGGRYMVYSTNAVRTQYSALKTEMLEELSIAIMDELCDHIRSQMEYVDLPKIIKIAELKMIRQWMQRGLLPITSLEAYSGHPLDPATQQLVTHVRVEFPDIILMDHEPPTDVEQEELPY